MPKVTILSLARVALKIVRGRKSLIPPSMLFPEGGNLKLRCSDCPFLFLKFLKESRTVKGVEKILRSGSRISTKTDTNLLLSCLEHQFQQILTVAMRGGNSRGCKSRGPVVAQ